MNELTELESIEIRERSFTIGKDWDSIKTSKRADGVCRIVNCPKLKTIEIGDYQGWKIHVMGVTLPRIRGFSYVTWQVFAILPINAMVAK